MWACVLAPLGVLYSTKNMTITIKPWNHSKEDILKTDSLQDMLYISLRKGVEDIEP